MENVSLNQIPNRTYNSGDVIYSINEPSQNVFLIHSGEVAIETRFGLVIGRLHEGEIFGERGPSLDESRSITAEAATSCVLYPISEKTLKEKIKTADPVLRAILRSLLIRLNDINVKSEDFWRNLNVMTSLTKGDDG